MPPEYSALLNTFKDHTTIANTLWGIFQAVSLAMLGYVFTQDYVRRSALILIGLNIGFFLFALGNQNAILRSQSVLSAVDAQCRNEEFVKSAPESLHGVLRAHSAFPVAEVRRWHYILTALVIVSTWVPLIAGRFKRREAGAKRITLGE